ncbi:hypothetical protein [uncultured Granulicatella sp.]|uniref:hypothetical protein n=1 Tax=uncultured Granulicatella sp. TaxID=316089 RepID=UPI0028D8DEC0|nr:hypothetical protein [uncultured Granulicatella sp.]
MAKTIRKMIRISTRRRKDGMKFNDEFYSYDRNNAKFEFLMEEDVPAEKVIALFHFEKTNRYYETVCSVQGNLITIDFDTSLIVEDENVSGYLYFNKLEQSTDVYRFNFGVVVSEIDKTRYLPEEAITLRQLFLTEIATKKEVAALIEGLKNEMSKLTGGDISQLVTKEELEHKHYLTNHQSLEEYAKKTELYNDEEVKTRISALENNASHFVTNEVLASKNYLTEHQSLSGVIQQVEERFSNLSNLYLTSHQSLDHLATKQELNAVENRVQQLESKPNVDLTHLATKEELEALRNSQPVVDTSNLATNAKVEAVEGRVQALENKPTIDTSEFAKKTEIPQAYDDSALSGRVSALEAKEDRDTVYNDTEIKSRLAAIESKNYLTEHQSLANYALKSEVPQAYNDTDLKERVTSLEAKALANGAYDDSNLRTRIHALETKEDKDTVYDDAEVQRRLSVLEAKPDVQVDTLVTKQELEAKGYLTNHQDVSGLATNSKVEAVEQRVQVLENKPDVDLSHVVTKDELASKNYLTTHQDISGLVTKQELEDKHYIQDVSNLATTEKVTAVENRVQALENKSVVTHEELESKHYLVEHQSLDGLVTKEELASKNYLTNHQSLDGYVTKSELEQAGYIKEHQSLTDYAKKSEMAELVTKEELESKGYIQDISGLATKQELEAAKASIPQPYNDTEIREELARKVNTDTLATLATKQELQTNDEEVKRRLTTLEGKTDNFITGVSVNKEGSNVTLTYNYVDGQSKNVSFTDSDTVNVAYDDSGVKARLTNLENRPQVDVTTLVSKAELPQSLENYALKSELYNDSALTQRVSNLENSTVTKQELQSKNYLTEHQSLTDYAKKSELYNDAAIVNRMNVLENGISKLVTNEELEGKNYLTSHQSLEEYVKKVELNNLVTRDELAGKGYLTQHQSLDGYALKTELPTPYNDSALVSRINALEVKTDNDTVYNDTEVKQRLTALESRPTGQSEMRGTGMPNGVVEAPIGATYIDTAKTNGALKWIKTTDGGNTGWKVVEGDTGWVLGWQEDKGNNKNRMYFRRINDVVHVKFEPKISDNVNAHEYNLILDTGGSDIFGQLSIQGFQSVDNIVQTIFKRTIDIPGDTYSAENSEASQGLGAVCLHYVYNNDSKRELELHIATSQFSSDENHVNPFSYLTEDEWPTTLPTL